MPTSRKHDCYIWASWLPPLMSGEAQCWWSAWFRAWHRYDKFEREGGDLATWKAEHQDMLIARQRELEADGWTVYVEDQNSFKLKGRSATVAGKCDLVAVRGEEARIEDCKSGDRKQSDVFQVYLYLFAAPYFHQAVQGKRISGAVRYRTASVEIAPEMLTPDLRERILASIRRIGAPVDPPSKVPSVRECRFCHVGPSDCNVRIDQPDLEVSVDLF